jgi:hypothetical protein
MSTGTLAVDAKALTGRNRNPARTTLGILLEAIVDARRAEAAYHANLARGLAPAEAARRAFDIGFK